MKVLVTGISGFVGARLAPRLLADGHQLRGLVRRTVPAIPGVELVTGDAITGAGLDAAVDGIEVVYYLIHSMERSAAGHFADRELVAAENVARAVQRAGV